MPNAAVGILTTSEDVEQFIDAGVDFLAPSVGNLHGDYGPRGPELDMNRSVAERDDWRSGLTRVGSAMCIER